MMASLQHVQRSFRVRHVRIELTSSGFRVRRPSNEHMAQTCVHFTEGSFEMY